MGVAILRAVGIVARRLGAGVMQYRMQASTRRAVTRQYLALPMEWHQRHPTGELLSNANADVEAAWGPIAPLPMAVGTVAMMLIAVLQMLFADLVLAMVGLLVFPARDRHQHRLPAPGPGMGHPGAAAARRGQRDRARVVRRRHGRQDAGSRDRGDGAVRREGPPSARRQHQGRPDPGGVRPDPRRPARTRRPGGARGGRLPGDERRHRARRRGHRGLPAHHRLVPDPVHRLAARRVPAQRRRLPPGAVGAPGHRRDAVRRRERPACRPRRRARRPGRHLPLHRGPAPPRGR